MKKNNDLPVFGSTIPLSTVLEPVTDLRSGETRAFRQFTFLPGRRIRVGRVPIPQHTPGFLFEAVRRFLAVPYCTRQRKLASYTILSYNTNSKHFVTSLLKYYSFQKGVLHVSCSKQWTKWWCKDVYIILHYFRRHSVLLQIPEHCLTYSSNEWASAGAENVNNDYTIRCLFEIVPACNRWQRVKIKLVGEITKRKRKC